LKNYISLSGNYKICNCKITFFTPIFGLKTEKVSSYFTKTFGYLCLSKVQEYAE